MPYQIPNSPVDLRGVMNGQVPFGQVINAMAPDVRYGPNNSGTLGETIAQYKTHTDTTTKVKARRIGGIRSSATDQQPGNTDDSVVVEVQLSGHRRFSSTLYVGDSRRLVRLGDQANSDHVREVAIQRLRHPSARDRRQSLREMLNIRGTAAGPLWLYRNISGDLRGPQPAEVVQAFAALILSGETLAAQPRGPMPAEEFARVEAQRMQLGLLDSKYLTVFSGLPDFFWSLWFLEEEVSPQTVFGAEVSVTAAGRNYV